MMPHVNAIFFLIDIFRGVAAGIPHVNAMSTTKFVTVTHKDKICSQLNPIQLLSLLVVIRERVAFLCEFGQLTQVTLKKNGTADSGMRRHHYKKG